MAQAQQASLFVSIHADTLKVSPEVHGLTVYTNSDRASDAGIGPPGRGRKPGRQRGRDRIAEAVEEVAGILGDLTRRETRSYSHLFAHTLVGQIEAASKLNKNPNRSARLPRAARGRCALSAGRTRLSLQQIGCRACSRRRRGATRRRNSIASAMRISSAAPRPAGERSDRPATTLRTEMHAGCVVV